MIKFTKHYLMFVLAISLNGISQTNNEFLNQINTQFQPDTAYIQEEVCVLLTKKSELAVAWIDRKKGTDEKLISYTISYQNKTKWYPIRTYDSKEFIWTGNPAFAEDDNNNIYLVSMSIDYFTNHIPTAAILEICKTQDGGQNWSDWTTIKRNNDLGSNMPDKPTIIAKGDGELRVSDTSLLKNGKFVFLSRERDGYSVISEVSLSEEAELKRIAEGRIGYYVLNEAGELFYAEVNAPTFTFYRQKSADRASREQLSTQQILLRQGSSGVDTYFPYVPWFMEAFVDPVLKQCKVDGVPIVKLGVEQTVPVGTNGAVSSEFCIQVPKESQGAEFSIAITGDVDTALSGNSYDVDDVELYDSANVYLETSGDPLLQRVTLSESSYRFQLASWNGAGKALVRFNLADATDTRQIYTIRFDQSRWEESESNRLACNAGSTLRSGKKISVTANVDSYGYAQETAFCVYQGPLHSNQLLIAGQNTSERIGASIYCSSLNNGSSIRYTYAQNDTYRNESFPIFYRSDKGLRSCTLRNYFDKPASNTKYSSTFTLVFNLVENSLADIRD